MADDLGVVDVGHDEGEVLHAALAELAEERVPLDREARPALLGRPVDARVRPGVTPRRAPGRDREWHTRDDHLPGGGRRGDAVDEPAALRRAEHGLAGRSEEHTSELQSHSDLVCRLLLEKKNT